VAYWLCDAIAPGNLRLGSSLVTKGLSWRSAVGIIALGHFLAALLITANGIIGARLHIPYTIQSRAPFGFFFSFFVVFVRLLVGFFWYGINTYNGALCVYAVLVAIWPSFANVPNHLPESANITTQMLTGTSALACISFRSLTKLSICHLLPHCAAVPLDSSTSAELVLQCESVVVYTCNHRDAGVGM
jgi:cytosine/uracil/thiamine/allantoin permease